MRKRMKQKTLYLNEKEDKNLKKRVKELKFSSQSALIRKVINEAQISSKPDDEFYKVMSKFNGLAVSLNKLTKQFHYNGWIDEKSYRFLIKYLNELMDEVKDKFFATE